MIPDGGDLGRLYGQLPADLSHQPSAALPFGHLADQVHPSLARPPRLRHWCRLGGSLTRVQSLAA